jgi:hypothetical protein
MDRVYGSMDPIGARSMVDRSPWLAIGAHRSSTYEGLVTKVSTRSWTRVLQSSLAVRSSGGGSKSVTPWIRETKPKPQYVCP